MSALIRVRDAAVEAVLAGTLAAVVEGMHVARHAGIAVAPVAAGTAAAGGIIAAIAAGALLATVVRVPIVSSWAGAVARGGQERAIAVWRAALTVVVVGVFGAVAFRGFAWAHARFRFNEADAIGFGLACALIVVAIVLVVGALALDRLVRARLPQTALDGRRLWLAGAFAGLVVLVTPAWIVSRAVPALTLDAVWLGSVLALAVIGARLVRPARYRLAHVGAGLAVVAAAVGTWSFAGSASARGAIVVHGVASAEVAELVRTLADGDGDGYAGPGAGGADCDDADPRRHPRARDVPGNGLDENCTGADAVATAYGLRTQTRPVPPVLARPSIVLISVDALRADRLGTYGYPQPTSPALDALAAGGVRFQYAYTSCPSTRCAIPSLHTGRFASTLPDGGPAREAVPNLARVLRDAGYATAAITCCERFALARDELAAFATIDASADAVRLARAGQSNADVVVDATLAWLAGLGRESGSTPGRPYFAWLHLYEPHFPYDAPGGPDLGDSASDRYDEEIAFADAQIARLVAALDPATIVVVTSDHGEELGEHGIRFHARSLYNQVIRVPLIMRVPGVAPRVVDTPVSIVDVMPTLLELAGIEGPAGMNGRSLVPALHGRAAPARPVLVELESDHQIERDMAAVVSPPWKVIWDREANAWSLYRVDDVADAHDRSSDPALAELQRLLLDTLDRETGVVP